MWSAVVHALKAGRALTPNRTFAKVLKEARSEKNVSQEDLAFTSGYHSTYISQLERGLKAPTLTTLLDLAAA